MSRTPTEEQKPMTTDALAQARWRLGHLLTQLDQQESAKERVVNIYQLGHYLTAADD